MSKTESKRKPGRNKGKRYAKPLSLYPLTMAQAIRALVRVRSNGDEKAGARFGRNGDK